jgi:hypothetical protein
MAAVVWEQGPRYRYRRAVVRRYQLVGAFAAILATCAVWVQVSVGSGVADRPGSGPLTALGAGPTSGSASLAVARVWVVQPGETVWRIARHLQPSGDVRPLVDQLSRQVGAHGLQVGQRLVIP